MHSPNLYPLPVYSYFDTLSGTETLPATMTLEIGALRLRATFDGDIKLQ